MRSAVSIAFSSISYFLVGFQRDINKFFIFLVTMFFASTFGSTVCLFASASVNHYGMFNIFYFRIVLRNVSVFLGVALILTIMIYLVMMIFSGFLIALKSIVFWLSWFQWISAFRYASNMLTINEFHDINFCLSNNTNVCPLPGSEILKRKEIKYSTQWDLWQNAIGMLIMAGVFLVLTYIQLRRIKKTN